MSFLRYKQYIEEGDTVIICRGHERYFPVEIREGGVIQVRGGAVHHKSLIGKKYGCKVTTSNGKNWMVALHPTPELWTQALLHRTQILYSTDISLLSLQLGLRPGANVLECGTGSGSLSHAIARTIAPNGHLYTFDFHEQRVEIARNEFTAHGLSDIVTVVCRDVCKDGFGMDGLAADAVFLDVPKPWEMIQSAKKALKCSGGRLSSFSPCIEQVQRVCEQLRSFSFTDIEVVETVQRPYNVREYTLNVPNMGGASTNTHKFTSPTSSQVTLYTARPTMDIPGHTGFLTFATLFAQARDAADSLSAPRLTATAES